MVRKSPDPSQAPRRPTPAEYSFVGDEEPTQPGCPRPADRWDTLARLLANLSADERRRFVVLADSWYQCDAEGRALLEALAGKLAG